MDFSDWWLRHLLWNCPNMNVTGLHWWSVNIDLGSGMVLSGNKPLPEPMLTQIFVAICVTRPQWVNCPVGSYLIIHNKTEATTPYQTFIQIPCHFLAPMAFCFTDSIECYGIWLSQPMKSLHITLAWTIVSSVILHNFHDFAIKAP